MRLLATGFALRLAVFTRRPLRYACQRTTDPALRARQRTTALPPARWRLGRMRESFGFGLGAATAPGRWAAAISGVGAARQSRSLSSLNQTIAFRRSIVAARAHMSRIQAALSPPSADVPTSAIQMGWGPSARR